nr:Ankyrin repeat family protein [Ipomoea batatas]
MASVEIENMSRGTGDRVDMLPDRLPDKKPEDWIEYFKFKYSRDPASDARNALLVVAALLVQVTYQAGINPPSYISNKNAGGKVSTASSLTVFVAANTLSLSAAMTMIEYLTANMPYQREMRISLFFMIFGYGWSSASTEPITAAKSVIIVVCALYWGDTASEARDALLVVAALIVQVTFEAGINPPSYIVQNAQQVSASSLNVFLVANTLSLSSAMTMIEYLTRNMPFQRELRISLACIMFGYGWSLAHTRLVRGTKIALAISCFLPFLARFLPNLFKRIRKTEGALEENEYSMHMHACDPLI